MLHRTILCIISFLVVTKNRSPASLTRTGLGSGFVMIKKLPDGYSPISTCIISHADLVTELPGPKMAATPARYRKS